MGQEGRKIYTCLRAPKAAAIAGILFAILIFISIVLLLTAMPEKSGDNLAWLTKHRNNLLLSFSLIPFAGIAFLWFMGVVRDYLGENEDQFLATVFLDSGLLFLATLFVAAASMGTVVFLSVTQAERLIASGMYDLAWNFSRYLMFVYATRMAGVFMISTSSLCIRTRVTPRWMSPDPPIRLEAPVIHAGEEKRTSGFSRLHPHG
jgi:hypothetical protein